MGILRPPLIAIDVGTATTRLCWGAGEVHERPSVAMRGGVVADVAGVAGVVRTLLATRRWSWRRPAAVVSVPTDASVREREALVEAVAAGGASVVAVVPEPLAAAIGAGLDVSSEYATPVVDVGAGVTDFAIFRNGSMVFSDAKRISLTPRDSVLRAIAAFVDTTLRNLPDALAAEVIESGIHVTGGGAKLPELVRRIEARSGLRVHCPSDPRNAVIRGTTEMLRNAKPGCYGAV